MNDQHPHEQGHYQGQYKKAWQTKILGWIFMLGEWKLYAINMVSPYVNIIPRLAVAYIFWNSAMLKLPECFLGLGRGSWENTILLFTDEHPVPFLQPETAAIIGTAMEMICPILLVIGLATRSAAVVLLVMVGVMEFTYQHSLDHVLWAALLAVIMFQGPGRLSIDHMIRMKTLRSPRYRNMIGS